LAYSQTHPERCKALILRGIFLLRESELQFFYQHGTSCTSHLWHQGKPTDIQISIQRHSTSPFYLQLLRMPTIVLMNSEEYSTFIPEEERGDLMTAYQKRLTGSDEALSLEAARRWSVWEESTNRLIQDPEGIAKAQTDDKWSRSVPRLSSTTRAPY
jgi:proline iminopeptidase